MKRHVVSSSNPPHTNEAVIEVRLSGDGMALQSLRADDRDIDKKAIGKKSSDIWLTIGNCGGGVPIYRKLITIKKKSIAVYHAAVGTGVVHSTELTKADTGYLQRLQPGTYDILPGDYYHGMNASVTGTQTGSCQSATSILRYD
jgi:hypothetical protein